MSSDSLDKLRLEIWASFCPQHSDRICSIDSLCEDCAYSIGKIMPLIEQYGIEQRIDELDQRLPRVMGYENVTPVVAERVSDRISELEQGKNK